MEDALVRVKNSETCYFLLVLILVLMEDALVPWPVCPQVYQRHVLILVLMEDALVQTARVKLQPK